MSNVGCAARHALTLLQRQTGQKHSANLVIRTVHELRTLVQEVPQQVSVPKGTGLPDGVHRCVALTGTLALCGWLGRSGHLLEPQARRHAGLGVVSPLVRLPLAQCAKARKLSPDVDWRVSQPTALTLMDQLTLELRGPERGLVMM